MFVINHTFIIHEPENIIEEFEVISNLLIKYDAKSCPLMESFRDWGYSTLSLSVKLAG